MSSRMTRAVSPDWYTSRTPRPGLSSSALNWNIGAYSSGSYWFTRSALSLPQMLHGIDWNDAVIRGRSRAAAADAVTSMTPLEVVVRRNARTCAQRGHRMGTNGDRRVFEVRCNPLERNGGQ